MHTPPVYLKIIQTRYYVMRGSAIEAVQIHSTSEGNLMRTKNKSVNTICSNQNFKNIGVMAAFLYIYIIPLKTGRQCYFDL